MTEASTPHAWKLQDAKARFSELVRDARTKGPQTVTVHGTAAVVVLSVEDYAVMAPAAAKQLNLYELLSNSPLRDLEFGWQGVRMPVRDVEL